MQATRLSDKVLVSGQVTPQDIAALAPHGITTLINNRPDREDPGQLDAAEAATIAEREGVSYSHIPVTGASLSRADVDAFGEAVAGAEGQVLAHCRSGTRSAILYVLSEVLAGRMDRSEIVPFGRDHGLDLSGALGWLDRNNL